MLATVAALVAMTVVLLVATYRSENRIMSALDDLKASVASQKTVTASAVTLIAGFSGKLSDLEAKLAAAGVDTTDLVALKADIDADTKALADAVSANTPAAPAPAAPAPATPPATPTP